jgi:hypothetical protein
MTSAGASDRDYSATPLTRKLGIKEGSTVGIVNEPNGFLDLLQPLPEGASVVQERATEPLDVLIYFTREQASASSRIPYLKRLIAPHGGLWVAYPKKSSKEETDLGFDFIQRLGLDAGLVDNKSCAIDDTWTAVRFVYRKEDRPGRAQEIATT